MTRQIEQSKTRTKETQKTINHLNRVELNTTTFQVFSKLWRQIMNFLGTSYLCREYAVGNYQNTRSTVLIFQVQSIFF